MIGAEEDGVRYAGITDRPVNVVPAAASGIRSRWAAITTEASVRVRQTLDLKMWTYIHQRSWQIFLGRR